MIGTQIENYRILERIGDGGMGSVYRALDVMLEREVALKFLRPELAEQPDLVQRFRAEAVVLARLNHQNVAGLFGLHRHGTEFYMAMEYVPGKTVEALLKEKGRLPVEHAVQIAGHVLQALDYAHRHGVVHRDIKSANIIVTPAGGVKVMDFGIARVLGTERRTRVGFVVGTIGYMAPEQIQGLDVDGRTDIYAVGVVLYEMLTGRMPFQGESEYAVMQAQVQQMPVPPRTYADIPIPIETALMRALAKQPGERYQTAAEFNASLQAAFRLGGSMPSGWSGTFARPADETRELKSDPALQVAVAAALGKPAVAGADEVRSSGTALPPPAPPVGAWTPPPAAAPPAPHPTPQPAPGPSSGVSPATPLPPSFTPPPLPSSPAVPVISPPLSQPEIPAPAVVADTGARGTVAAPDVPVGRARRALPPAILGLIGVLLLLTLAGAGVLAWQFLRGGDAAGPPQDQATDGEAGAPPAAQDAADAARPDAPVRSEEQPSGADAPAAAGGQPGQTQTAAGQPPPPTATPAERARATRRQTPPATAETEPASTTTAVPIPGAPLPPPEVPAPPRPSLPPAMFGGVKWMQVQGARFREVDAYLQVTDSGIRVLDRRSRTSLASASFGELTAAVYSQGKRPQWRRDVGPAPEESAFNETLRSYHYVAFQGRGQFVLARVDRGDLARLRDELQKRSSLSLDLDARP